MVNSFGKLPRYGIAILHQIINGPSRKETFIPHDRDSWLSLYAAILPAHVPIKLQILFIAQACIVRVVNMFFKLHDWRIKMKPAMNLWCAAFISFVSTVQHVYASKLIPGYIWFTIVTPSLTIRGAHTMCKLEDTLQLEQMTQTAGSRVNTSRS